MQCRNRQPDLPGRNMNHAAAADRNEPVRNPAARVPGRANEADSPPREGALVLNLGCGFHTSRHAINIDHSPYMRIKRSRLLSFLAMRVLNERRKARLTALSGRVLSHDLRKPLPFGDGTADAVYHSHVLEHLPRESALPFILEAKRVLKPGGVLRIVVPDFEYLCRQYLSSAQRCGSGPANRADHERRVEAVIEQLVREESHASRNLPPIAKWLESVFLGGARRKGEKHLWMYDRHTLAGLLDAAGFVHATAVECTQSRIPGWNRIGLDLNGDGTPRKTESLYMEALKP